jgi:hypothetical protein
MSPDAPITPIHAATRCRALIILPIPR